MTEKTTLTLLTQLVKESDEILSQDKDEVLKGMKFMQLKYIKTSDRGNYVEDFKAYIHIHIPFQFYVKVNKYIELFEELVLSIFHEEGYFLNGIHIFPEEMEIDADDLKEEIVYLPKLFFKDIESEVIKRINGAETQINIAMYLFTNPKIYKVLMKKKEEGVHIEIILDDNENNKKEAKNWPELNIHYYKPNENNIMHNKFCIIDMNTVIRGSYNWTNAANYNNEEISVDMTSSTVKAYAAVFDKLRIDVA